MKKALPLFLLLLCVVGCKTAGVNGQPTAPSQGYQQAAQQMSNFATDLQQVQQAEINLYHGGVIDNATHVTIQNTFKNIATYGKQGDALIAAQASAVTIRAKINAAMDSIGTISTATGQLDPNTAAQLNASIVAFKILLNSVLSSLPTPVAEVPYGSYRYSYAG